MMRTHEEIFSDGRLLFDFLSGHAPTPERADFILALGSHDLRVAGYAAQLWHEKKAPLIVCTGGLGKITDGLWDTPEGVVFAGRCRELGVPEDRILIEKVSTNTGENFTFSRALLCRLGLCPQTGLVVCKPYMAQRAWATGTKQWSGVAWSVLPPPLTFEEYLGEGGSPEQELELMVGDLQRLKVYAERGFQAPVAVPDRLWEAYRRLVQDGFDRFVIAPEGD